MSRCLCNYLGPHVVLGITKGTYTFIASWVLARVVFLSLVLTLMANYIRQIFTDFYLLISRFVFVCISIKIPSEIHVFFVGITRGSFAKLKRWRSFLVRKLAHLWKNVAENQLNSDKLAWFFWITQDLLFSLKINRRDGLFKFVEEVLLLQETQALTGIMSGLQLVNIVCIFSLVLCTQLPIFLKVFFEWCHF